MRTSTMKPIIFAAAAMVLLIGNTEARLLAKKATSVFPIIEESSSGRDDLAGPNNHHDHDSDSDPTGDKYDDDTMMMLENCPDFQPSYACTKVDGNQPQFFDTVHIARINNSYFEFTTTMLPGFPITELKTQYYPDRVVRLGSDNHYPKDGGPPMENLPSHETSYCEDGILFRSETTFLPSNTFAQEIIRMHINDQDQLVFDLKVDGELALMASCDPIVGEH